MIFWYLNIIRNFRTSYTSQPKKITHCNNTHTHKILLFTSSHTQYFDKTASFIITSITDDFSTWAAGRNDVISSQQQRDLHTNLNS